MIRFIRKIRWNTLKEGSIPRYVAYACGEIILVMIGILLALQVNAYQQERADRETEQTVLLKLKSDIEKDLIDLNRLLNVKNEQFVANEYMLHLGENPDTPIPDTLTHINNARLPFYFYIDNANRTSFETAKSSGDLFKVTNDPFLDLLSFYFSDENMHQYLVTIKEFSSSFVSEVFIQKYSLPTETKYLHIFEESYLTDYIIQNYHIIMKTHLDVGNNLIQRKLSIAESLIQLIDHELAVSVLSDEELNAIYTFITEENKKY